MYLYLPYLSTADSSNHGKPQIDTDTEKNRTLIHHLKTHSQITQKLYFSN